MPVAALAAATVLAACGEDDFANEDRPPAPVELTALVNDRAVVVSPGAVGAGPVVVTVSNQSQDAASLTLDGPTQIAGGEIPPGGVGELKAVLEQGDYEVTGGEGSSARPGAIDVGPERESSQNELLLP